MKKLLALLVGTVMLCGCMPTHAAPVVKPHQQVQMEQLGTHSNCYQPLMFYVVSQSETVGQEVVANMVMSLSDNGFIITDENAEESIRGFSDVCLINPDKTFSEIATIYTTSHQ